MSIQFMDMQILHLQQPMVLQEMNVVLTTVMHIMAQVVKQFHVFTFGDFLQQAYLNTDNSAGINGRYRFSSTRYVHLDYQPEWVMFYDPNNGQVHRNYILRSGWFTYPIIKYVV